MLDIFLLVFCFLLDELLKTMSQASSCIEASQSKTNILQY